MTEQLLDDTFHLELQQYLMAQEEILWKGKPLPKFNITLLEMGSHYDAMSGASNAFGIIVGFSLIGAFLLYTAGYILGAILSIVIGFLIIVTPDYIKHKRKINTQYAFTSNRIFFKLWWYGKESIHFIRFEDISSIILSESKDGSGVLRFIPKNKVFEFDTHDFGLGSKRQFPTFELIANVAEVHQQLEQIRKQKLLARNK